MIIFILFSNISITYLGSTRILNSALIELEIRTGDGGHRVDAFLAFGLVPIPCFARNGSILGNLLDAFHTTDKGGGAADKAAI
jgi:hypothetical protein